MIQHLGPGSKIMNKPCIRRNEIAAALKHGICRLRDSTGFTVLGARGAVKSLVRTYFTLAVSRSYFDG